MLDRKPEVLFPADPKSREPALLTLDSGTSAI
jgi:hypothetical protein